MTAVTDALDLTRDALVAAIHDQLQGALDLPRIVTAVDLALKTSALEVLLTGLAQAKTTITALAGEVPVPPPGVQAELDTWEDREFDITQHYDGIVN